MMCSRSLVRNLLLAWGAWLALCAPAPAQQVLSLAAALDEAIYFNPDLVALRRQPPTGDAARARLGILQRASDVLADVRRAYADLVIAREGVELYNAQVPLLREMVQAATLRYAAGENAAMHPAELVAELARLSVARSTWHERGRVSELRLNALLGRRLDQPLEPLAERNLIAPATDSEQRALERQPSVALAALDVAAQADEAAREAAVARRDANALAVRQRVREASIRVDAARERVLLINDTIIPQLQQAFDAAEAAYARGRVGLIDMLSSHHALLGARVDYVNAYAAFDRALVELEIATGEEPQRIAPAVRPEGAR
jgi:outer membrane protein TolC